MNKHIRNDNTVLPDPRKGPLRLALLYPSVVKLWIVGSDYLAVLLFLPGQLTAKQTWKVLIALGMILEDLLTRIDRQLPPTPEPDRILFPNDTDGSASSLCRILLAVPVSLVTEKGTTKYNFNSWSRKS